MTIIARFGEDEILWQGEPVECAIEYVTETVCTDDFGRSPFISFSIVPVRRTIDLTINAPNDLDIRPGDDYALYMKEGDTPVRYTVYVTRVQANRNHLESWVRIEGVLS